MRLAPTPSSQPDLWVATVGKRCAMSASGTKRTWTCALQIASGVKRIYRTAHVRLTGAKSPIHRGARPITIATVFDLAKKHGLCACFRQNAKMRRGAELGAGAPLVDRSPSCIASRVHSGCAFQEVTLPDANVRYWHKADIPSCTANVRFWGQSGHCLLGTHPPTYFSVGDDECRTVDGWDCSQRLLATSSTRILRCSHQAFSFPVWCSSR